MTSKVPEFVFSEPASLCVTRNQGKRARELLKQMLGSHSRVRVNLDLLGASSPSFIDEFLGLLADELGREEFRSRLELTSTSSSTKALVNRILSERFVKRSSRLAGLRS